MLPAGWEIRHSQSRNRPYYFHPATGTSQWDPPGSDGAEIIAPGNASLGKLHAYHLLVKHAGSRRPSSWRTPTITRSLAEAKTILSDYERLIRESADSFTKFKELAAQFSDCSSAKRMGDLGEFGAGEMQPAFEQATRDTLPGSMSGMVETDSGVHLIWRIK